MLSRISQISLFCSLLLMWCPNKHSEQIAIKQYAGLSFVAPPQPFSSNPMDEINNINANAIAVIPYGFTRIGEPDVRFNVSKWQWWGEKEEGIVESIHLAHQKNLAVMVKPQLYIPGSWTGFLSFDSEAAWEAWETKYTAYIMRFAHIADSMQAELFCIGTELKESVTQRPDYWRTLIERVRSVYSGKLTYAANWDDFEVFPHWSKLDYIGIDAYFPLSDEKTPSQELLIKAWSDHEDKIDKTSKMEGKPILFTEYGYLSIDHCADKTWELEKTVRSSAINEMAQANAFAALFHVFQEKPYWSGGFIWKWFPNGHGHEGYPERDYTPQGKMASEVIRDRYAKFKLDH